MTDEQIDAIERELVRQGKPAMTFIERYAFARAIEQHVLEEAAAACDAMARGTVRYEHRDSYEECASAIRALKSQ